MRKNDPSSSEQPLCWGERRCPCGHYRNVQMHVRLSASASVCACACVEIEKKEALYSFIPPLPRFYLSLSLARSCGSVLPAHFVHDIGDRKVVADTSGERENDSIAISSLRFF